MFRNALLFRRGILDLVTLAVGASLLGGTLPAKASDRAVLGELFSMDN